MPIYLVRHGETAWTLSGRHTGATEVPLTAGGVVQAEGLRALLGGLTFDRVLVSPRERARRTAELAGFAGRFEVAPSLAEYRYGEYEGLTGAEIQARRPGWELWRDGCPGGETPDEVLERARQLIRELNSAPAARTLLFGHGHILRAVAAAYLGEPVGICRHLIVKVASVSVLGQEHGLPAIESWDLVQGPLRPAAAG
ncbi:MAG: histidine phosphatase family protein [Candidatus Dormiibacterota bacterium]